MMKILPNLKNEEVVRVKIGTKIFFYNPKNKIISFNEDHVKEEEPRTIANI